MGPPVLGVGCAFVHASPRTQQGEDFLTVKRVEPVSRTQPVRNNAVKVALRVIVAVN